MIYRKIVKRILDFILALIGLIVLSPVFVVLILLVQTRLGSPVFFHQDRPGYRQRIFRLLKFRTMTEERGADGELLPDAVRLTGFGKFLRRTSLDELPELLNILKGDMSFIGPRPLLVSYLPYYTEREQLRHAVRPGLTGLAQVSGRNMLDWDQRMDKDVEYVENLSFGLDLRIIVMTVRTVLGHSEQVAEDTNAAEGNFAQIRAERLKETGRLRPEEGTGEGEKATV